MTFLELVQRLQTRTGTGGSDVAQVVGNIGDLRRLVNYVQEAWTEIQAKRRDWSFRFGEFSVACALGSQTYNIQTLLGTTIERAGTLLLTLEETGVANTKTRVELFDYGFFEDIYSVRDVGTGRPTACAFLPNFKQVKFNVILDKNYTLKGKYELQNQTLAANGDVPTLPEQYHMAIFERALMKWAEFEEAAGVYNTAKMAYEDWLTTMVNDLCPKILVGQDAMA